MSHQVVLITGAAGFLGSAITVDLARDHKVIALDRRKPSRALVDAAPDATWWQADIADAPELASVFAGARETFGRIDFVVHLAAYYHFGTAWRREYERTNVQGTDNVLQLAIENGASRVIFASSLAALRPPPTGERLTEKTVTAGYIPYAESKSIGENMVREASERLPGVVLRIGGAFSDWCELPPLSSLIRQWAGRSPLRRLVVGQGKTGIPYIHRDDVARIVRCCMDHHEKLDRYEVFLACQEGAVLHKDLFTAIQRTDARTANLKPIHVSPRMAKLGLYGKIALGCLTCDVPIERPWMLQYVDRPWVADTTHTRSKLGWSCTEGMGVLDRLLTILDRFRQDRRVWERRNKMRNRRQYAYYAPGS